MKERERHEQIHNRKNRGRRAKINERHKYRATKKKSEEGGEDESTGGPTGGGERYL